MGFTSNCFFFIYKESALFQTIDKRTNVLYIELRRFDILFKSYRFRIYPNDNQKKLIHKTFGCYRFIYNYFLNQCKLNGYKKAFDMIEVIHSFKELKDGLP